MMVVFAHDILDTENMPELDEVDSVTVLLKVVSVSPPAVFAAIFIRGLVSPAVTVKVSDTNSSATAPTPEVIVSICVPEVKPARDTVIVEVPVFVSL